MAQREFHTTHWSVVLTAADATDQSSVEALEQLCRAYWYPLYAFVRRSGHGEDVAADLTQGFFAHLLSGGGLNHATPERGRFRTFLLASLKNFLTNEWDRNRRLKRGGDREIVSWEGLDPEERYENEPAVEITLERLYDRKWAQALMGQTLKRLRAEFERDALGERFELLKVFLSGKPADDTYAAIGQRLALGEAAVKSAIFRLRRRYAEIVREEVAKTVASPDEIDSEIRHLFAASQAEG